MVFPRNDAGGFGVVVPLVTPELSRVEKTANPTSGVKVGDTVTYTVNVKNTGNVTVSGITKQINEETGVPFAVEELNNDLKNFTEGWIWKKAAGTIAVYNDDDYFSYEDPESGNVVMITPNVSILESTYKLGYDRDYKTMLTDVMLYGDYIDKRE